MSFSLSSEISSYFSNHQTHVVKNLLLTTEGIFAAKTTNLNKVKDELGTILKNQATPHANYTRLIRFFNMDVEEKQQLTRSLLLVAFCLLNAQGKPKYLVLDGTSWELGDRPIHLMTLCVLVGGVSIPICWQDLEKKGISNEHERMELMKKALSWYDLSGMILLADCEYIGRRRLNFLLPTT